MSQTVTFGIVGGGATGMAVVTELRKSCDREILIGGRDLEKAKALAAEFDNRVSAAHVDVLNSRSLDDFCSRCPIVVNCGGPVMALQDRVAQAALRRRCHYVDVAGLSFVKEGVLPRTQEIADLGLSFVVSAGWIPGISELLPAYAHARAKTKMDALDLMTVYFGDSGEWSTNALRDAVWHLQHLGLRRPGYIHKGEWTRAKSSAALRKIALSRPVGSRRFSMFLTPELMELGRCLSDFDLFAYSLLPSFRTALAGALIALVPVPEGLAIRLLRNALRNNSLPVGGFVVVEVRGHAEERNVFLTVQVIYDKHRGYWINGLVPATVARMISEQKGIRQGVHFLADGVDPLAFMAELRNAGVDQTET